jgi:DNA-directed RNA polymerase II subunit RPB1
MTTALDLNEPFSSAELKKVARVEFGILSPQQVIGMSVCKVESGNIYFDGLPVRAGLNDPRLGTIDFRKPCETCGMKQADCQGHFGHVELAKPMYHYGFLKTTIKALRCVCFYCSKLLADPADLNVRKAAKLKNPKARLARMQDLCRAKHVCVSGGMTGSHAAAAGLSSASAGVKDPNNQMHGCGL